MRPHKNLLAWKDSIELVEAVYKLSNNFPESEKFGLTSQLQRAAISIPTNIAEGAARNTKKEFIQFLYISSGSLSEVDTLITIASNLKYLKNEELKMITQKMDKISSLLNGLIKKLKMDIKVQAN
ncbi:MAG: four helix bundle protein [Bacteroidia bacterium]|nr:four helix bundle protein [Bacteroidia bacterium]